MSYQYLYIKPLGNFFYQFRYSSNRFVGFHLYLYRAFMKILHIVL